MEEQTIETGMLIEGAFNSIGESMYSDDLACELLAYTLVFGGGDEAVTQNKALRFAIMCAQKKLNLYGGRIPNVKLINLLQSKIKELSENRSKTVWLQNILDRYNIRVV